MITFVEPAITVAASADGRCVTDIIARAFAADPPSRWLYPDDDRYWRFFPRFVEVFGGSAIGCGTAEIAADGGAAAFWLPPGAHPDEAALGALLEESVDPASASARRSRCSSGWPATIRPGRTGTCRSSASTPAQQGRGYGSVLLEHAAARCDRERPAGVSRVDEPEKRRPVSAPRVRGGRGDSRGKRAAHLSDGAEAQDDRCKI